MIKLAIGLAVVFLIPFLVYWIGRAFGKNPYYASTYPDGNVLEVKVSLFTKTIRVFYGRRLVEMAVPTARGTPKTQTSFKLEKHKIKVAIQPGIFAPPIILVDGEQAKQLGEPRARPGTSHNTK